MNETIATLIGIGVQTSIFLVGGIAMVVRTEVVQKMLAKEVADMKLELNGLANIITVQAVQTTKLENLTTLVASIEKRVEDLRRGTGWIQRERKTVDGEYP